MAEQINISPKIKGNKLTAEEFNEVISKTNASITELNETISISTGHTEEISVLSEDINALSEIVSGHTEDINILSGITSGHTEDINILSGITSGHTEDISVLSGITSGHTEDISILSGITSGHTEDINDLDERVIALETGGTGGGASIERIIWTEGQAEPVIDAETIIGKLEEGDTHLVAEFSEGANKVAIINNINKQFPEYSKQRVVLPYFPDAEMTGRKQGEKTILLDYTSWNFLFRVNSDGSNDEAFTLEIGYDNTFNWFSIDPLDGSIYVNMNEAGTYNNIFKYNSEGIRNIDFDNTKFAFDIYGLTAEFEIQSTGKIICCYNDTINNSFNIIRLNSDGSKDSSFNDIISGNTQQNYPRILILSNDEIIYQSDDYILRKYTSEGVEDVNFSTNLSQIQVGGELFYNKNTVFSDDSFLIYYYDYSSAFILGRINADGTLNSEYTNTIANTFTTLNLQSLSNELILNNDELIINGRKESEESYIIKIDSNGYFVIDKIISGFGGVVLISDNNILIQYFPDYNYLYSEVYNISNFSNIIETIVEKPHYALQSQLEYSIFTPNTYYLPIVLSFDYTPGTFVFDEFNSSFIYYLFNPLSNIFEEIYIKPISYPYNPLVGYLNSIVLVNDASEILIFDENMLAIPVLSEVYDDPIVRIPYFDCQFGINKALLELNDRKVVVEAINDSGLIVWYDAITNEQISSWTYPTTGETFVIHKLTNTKVALRHMEMIDMGHSAWKISYLKYELDIETGEVIDLTPDPTTGTTVMRKYVDGISYGIFKIGDTETAESDIIIDLPNGDSIRETSYYYYGNIAYNIPFAVLSSTSDIKILSYDSYSNLIKLFDMSQNETILTNLNNFEIAMKYCQDSTSGLFQYYDFFKTEDYYYLVLNSDVGCIFISVDAITWTMVEPSNISIFSGGPYANICGRF